MAMMGQAEAAACLVSRWGGVGVGNLGWITDAKTEEIRRRGELREELMSPYHAWRTGRFFSNYVQAVWMDR